MPFAEVSVARLKGEFVRLAAAEGSNLRQLCRRFGISPTTGYKWLARWRAAGEAGLAERSRRPATSPGRCPAAVEAAVLAVRQAHPVWGGRKIARLLQLAGQAAPAPSTVTAILRRGGAALGAFGGGRADWTRFERAAPNELWQMDFKGHVAMGDGARLHPLTVLDDHSRYAVVLAACPDQRSATVRAALVAAFRRYGLPQAIITDNGAPWGDGPGSPFTPLGVFLIEQGIRIAHARPYHPQTMGKDERFHRTLKAEVLAGPAFASLAAAAASFAAWRQVYNTRRPHEALGLMPPASRYQASHRDFRETPDPFDYGPDDLVRRVQQGGEVSLHGRILRLPRAFRGKLVAFRRTDTDEFYDVFFRTQFIASLRLRSTGQEPKCVHHLPEHTSTLSPV